MPNNKKKGPTSGMVHPQRKGSEPGRRMTSERIDADLDAFRAAGGHIEVLGITYVDLKKKKPGKDEREPQA